MAEAAAKGEQGLDMDRLSRVIGAYGVEAMQAFASMRVLLIGLTGAGAETAKNLVLTGPSAVTLWDPNPVKIQDLGVNCFLREEHVGKTLAESTLPELKELNPHVRLTASDADVPTKPGSGADSLEGFKKLVAEASATVVVVTRDVPMDVLVAWGGHCHEEGILFLVGLNRGVTCTIFADFSNKGGTPHIVTDPSGEPLKTMSVADINVTAGEDGKADVVLTLATLGDAPHGMDDGGWLKVEDVRGMPVLNEKSPWEIRRVYDKTVLSRKEDGTPDKVRERLSPSKVRLVPKEDLEWTKESLGSYETGGVVTEFNQPKPFTFVEFESSWKNPKPPGDVYPPSPVVLNQETYFANRGNQLHLAQVAVWRFWESKGRLPELHSAEDAEECCSLAKDVMWDDLKSDPDESFDAAWAKVVSSTALYCQAELPGTASFLGGVLAQEVVKRSGKYTPLQQWLHVDFFELLPDKPLPDAKPTGTRYDHQIAVFGAEFQKKLASQNWFLVGCGALGCEYIKGFALMGMATGGGVLHVTDLDRIEVSNLSRQFLFRQENVGQQKSRCAAARAKVMNPSMNISCHEVPVGTNTETHFHSNFWDSLHGVCNALDNVKARLYSDSKCVLHTLPLLESGTLGTKANSEIVIPHKTMSYSEHPQESGEVDIPMCTLKNFPHMLEHCIEWARAQFTDVFEAPFKEFNKYVSDRDAFFKECKKEEAAGKATEAVRTCKRIQELMQMAREPTFDAFIKMAVDLFVKNFRNNIKQLITVFPEDFKKKDPDTGAEAVFWAAPKRFPRVLEYDIDDDFCFGFIYTAANIFANCAKQPYIRDKEEFKAAVKKLGYEPEEFVPSLKAKKELEAEAAEEGGEKKEEKKEEAEPLDEVISRLREEDVSSFKPVEPQDFEKDDDSNFHIDFMTASTNARAWTYRITEGTRHKVKMIAGRIIPALATTTAMITGLVEMELYKLLLGLPKEKFLCANINLGIDAIAGFKSFEPQDAKKEQPEFDDITLCELAPTPPDFTTWDKTVLEGELTVGDVVTKFSELFEKNFPGQTGVKVTSLFAAESPEQIWSEDEPEKDVDKSLREAYEALHTADGEPIGAITDAFVRLEGTYEKDGEGVKIPKLLWFPKGRAAAPAAEAAAPVAAAASKPSYSLDKVKMFQFRDDDSWTYLGCGMASVTDDDDSHFTFEAEEKGKVLDMLVKRCGAMKQHKEQQRAMVWTGENGADTVTVCAKLPSADHLQPFCDAWVKAGAAKPVMQ
eukprot:TRINITY_DN32336_c0_g1_i1.p1 TRINITY_DN32336_c0_g1~~TRINITY_DN32336_c0_g1_i1.p1  ORF type:complete len:1249 (+),score=452.60 TRINITY_DN32336_c0_g1_i1:67-3813(+)